MNRLIKRWFFVPFLLAEITTVKSQFIGAEIDSSLSPAEVRKGSRVEYSLSDQADDGDEFRWEVRGGTIVAPSGATGVGTPDNPSVLEFTAGLHTIEVQWQTDDSTASPIMGDIRVQKKTSGECASSIMKQEIIRWSSPTVSFDDNYPDFSICSGESAGGFIVVNLTGAAAFTFRYRIHSDGLHDESGHAINTEFREINTANDTVHISLPVRLINPSRADSKDYVIELISMNDDFLGDGEPVAGKEVFTITVYPALSIDRIESIKLNRR